MRALGYRELVWTIVRGRSQSDFSLVLSGDEQEQFQTIRRDNVVPAGFPMDLTGLLARSDRSTPRWIRRRVSQDEARRLGSDLMAALPLPARQQVEEHDLFDGVLRLKIVSDVPAVADLPWEWLFAGTAHLALRPDVRLTRSVPVHLPTPPLSVELPLRVVLVVPNPKDERSQYVPAEIEALRGGLGRPEYELTVVEEPSVDVLLGVLSQRRPNVFHFVGHGGLVHGEGNLIFQDDMGRSRWVSATELAQLLPASVRLVCLSTPFTVENYQMLGLCHLARSLGLVALPTVITNQSPIGQDGAEVFWRALYAGVLEHRGNINDAFHDAQVETARTITGYADWAAFSLVIRDQTGVSFDLGRAQEEADRRRPTELAAQFASQLANDLAEQVLSMGDNAPKGLREQFEVEQTRAVRLYEDLAE
jgi:hypothetical protein